MKTYKDIQILKLNYNNIIPFWIYDRKYELVYLNIEGYLGILTLIIPKVAIVAISKNFIYLSSKNKKYIGITTTLLKRLFANIKGVTSGYQINLVLSGVGYKVNIENSQLHFYLGYSHKIIVSIPQSIQAEITNQGTGLILKSINKIELGQIAARIMALRPIDLYKGKGITNKLTKVNLKQGKTKQH